MRISVVMTTHNRQKDCSEAIYSALNQKVEPYEIIVIDDASEPAFRFQHPKVKVIRNNGNLGLAASRNIGIKAAKGDIIAFTDDDVLPTRRWLIEMKKSFEAGAEVVGGVSKPLFEHGTKIAWWWDEALLGSYVAVGNEYKMNASGIWGCNFAIRKDVVRKIGYFDQDLEFVDIVGHFGRQNGEDTEFVMRAVRGGLEVRFNPCAVVYHKLNNHRLDLAYYKTRALRGGCSMKKIVKKYNCNIIIALFKSILLQAFRGLYLVLTRKSKVAALPIYMEMLLYQVIGCLCDYYNLR